MQSVSKSKNNGLVNDIIYAIRHKERENTLIVEVLEFEKVVRAIGQLLTPEQCARLKDLSTVKTLLHQDNVAPARSVCCGTLGGFGTEELEEWERAKGWLLP